MIRQYFPSLGKSIVNEKRYWGLITLIMFFLLSPALSPAWAVTIRAELDRNRVSLNESFTLVFEAEGSVDRDPDFTPIEELFEILHKNEGSTTRIINGQFSQKKKWTLTLMGKETGFFTIPSISFGKDKSPELRVDIERAKTSQKSASTEPLFIEVSVDPQTGYVQSQFTYTVKFYHAVTLLSGKLSEPNLNDADVVIKKLGEDREFETTRNGKHYRIVERRYALFPQQSGRLSIAPITFTGQLASRSQSRFNPFPGGGPIRRLRSEQIEIEVNAVPQDKIRGRWLPARNLRIVEAWPEVQEGKALSKAGEPVTWTLSLMAEGLTAAQLPEISPRFPDSFKSYPDQAVLNDGIAHDGLIGVREEKVAFIPTQAGSFLLPAIEIPWWNTTTGKMEIARLPERRIEIAPADQGEQTGPSVPFENEAVPSRHSVERPASDKPPRGSGFWSWISLVLALGWAVTLIAWWGSRQSPAQVPVPEPENQALPKIGQIKRQLKKACMQNEAHAAKEVLLSWAHILHPTQTPSLGKLGKQTGQALAEEISRLNGVLYSSHSNPWQDGPRLWAAFEMEMSATQKKGGHKADILAPMTPR